MAKNNSGGTEAHVNRGKGPVKTAHRIDEHIGNQVLAGDHMHFLRTLRFLEQAAEMRRPMAKSRSWQPSCPKKEV